jgi:hypothetical protein
MNAVSHDPAAAPPTALGRAAYRTGRVLGRAQAFVERVPPWLVLGAVVVLNWAIVAEVGRIALHDGPLWYHGGDGTWYYTTAWSLGHGRIPYAMLGYGYSLLIAPIAAIAGPSLLAAMAPIIVFNQLVLAPVAIVCVYGLARLLGGRVFAYLATLLWVLLPVLVIHYFLADYHSRWVDNTLPSLEGLIPLGDFPSMVILLVAAYFTLRLVATGRYADGLAAGFAAGLAVAVKPANLIFLPAPVIVLLVARRWRGLAVLAAATVPSLLGLTAWKERGLGNLPAFSSGAGGGIVLAALAVTLVSGIHLDLGRYIHLDWGQVHHNLDGFREYTWSQRMIYFGALGGLVGLLRRCTPAALLAATWLGAYMIVKGSAGQVSVSLGGFFTHMLAAFPAYFLLLISLPFLLPFYGRRENAPRTPRGGRFPAVAAGVLGFISIAGAVAVAVLPTSTSATAASIPIQNLLVPIDAFPVTATTRGPAVTLSWKTQPTHGAQVMYSVLRSPAAQGSDCPPIRGASSTCTYNGVQVGSTDGAGTSFTDHPPAGYWIYRVGLSASPLPPLGSSDYLFLSHPVRVAIRAGASKH